MALRRGTRLSLIIVIVALVCLAFPAASVAAGAETVDPLSAGQLQPLLYLVTWLLPLGVTLVAAGISEPSQVRQVVNALPLALVTSLGGYWLCGYAFHFGGVGLVTDAPELAWLVSEWSPLDLSMGYGWGLVGLSGFALHPTAMGAGLDLFVFQLPLVTTAALIPLIALNGHAPRLPTLFLALLVSCVCYPLAGNWIRGGGWLSHLGSTLGLGHGFVDYGLSSLHLVGGGAALAGLLAFRRYEGRQSEATAPAADPEALELPRAFLPLNVLAGAFLALVGWSGTIMLQPLVPQPQDPALLTFNILLAVGGAALATLFYGWLARGEPDPALTGRGILSALVAVGAGLPFMPFWAAALLGAFCGLLLAPTMYFVARALHLDDRGAVVSVHCASAIWGLVAVGLFADGSAGLGWNLYGSQGNSLASGVTGYLAATGPGSASQLYGQLIGVAAVFILGGLFPWTFLTIAARAYALPSTMRQRARERAAQLRQDQRTRETLRRQGRGLRLWQAMSRARLRSIAAPFRLLARRALPGRHSPRSASNPGRRRSQRAVGTRRLGRRR